MNKKVAKTPNTSKLITVAEDQENVKPPKLRPSRSISVPPMMSMLPDQSTALMPAKIGVPGESFGMVKTRKTKQRLVIGRLIQKHHLQLQRENLLVCGKKI